MHARRNRRRLGPIPRAYPPNRKGRTRRIHEQLERKRTDGVMRLPTERAWTRVVWSTLAFRPETVRATRRAGDGLMASKSKLWYLDQADLFRHMDESAKKWASDNSVMT